MRPPGFQGVEKRILTSAEFQGLIDSAEVVASNNLGPNVFCNPDGTIIKLFRPWKRMSSSLIRPYAKRFIVAAVELKRRGVPTLEPEALYRLTEQKQHAVRYRPLAGQTLRKLLDEGAEVEPLMSKLAGFCALLHDKGIYFRSMHLDNVVVGADGEFGLIDLTATEFSARALGIRKRMRNFKPFVRLKPDRQTMTAYGPDQFVEKYLQAAGLSKASNRILLDGLRRQDRIFCETSPAGEGGEA